ncbi:hypothetical protein [Enterobacter cloacae complex sp. 288G10]|uniref:hypothetical protein n=1 Tax=Enterobacter cloacae complex sp. 288G10 TaxID=3395859 RepID=UPI003CEEF073
MKQRRDLYVEQRIEEQRTWYAKKSVFNKRLGRAWAVAILIFYILSLTMMTPCQRSGPSRIATNRTDYNHHFCSDWLGAN